AIACEKEHQRSVVKLANHPRLDALFVKPLLHRAAEQRALCREIGGRLVERPGEIFSQGARRFGRCTKGDAAGSLRMIEDFEPMAAPGWLVGQHHIEPMRGEEGQEFIELTFATN